MNFFLTLNLTANKYMIIWICDGYISVLAHRDLILSTLEVWDIASCRTIYAFVRSKSRGVSCRSVCVFVWVCMCACLCVNVFLSLCQCKNVCASAYYRSSWSRPKEKRVLCVLYMPTPFCEAEFRNEGFDIRTIILVVVAVVEWKTNVNVVVARETSIHKHRTHVW